MTVAHRALNGDQLLLDGPGHLDLSRPATSVTVFSLGPAPRTVPNTNEREFTSGILRFASEFARYVIKNGIEDSYDMDGAVVRVVRDSWHDGSVIPHYAAAAWEGRQFSLLANMGVKDPADFVNLLKRFDIAEFPDGLVMTAADSSIARTAKPTYVTKEIPGVGILNSATRAVVESAVAAGALPAEYLPKEPGTPVRSGELYSIPASEDGSHATFLVVGDTAVTIVIGARYDPSEVSQNLAELSIDMQAA